MNRFNYEIARAHISELHREAAAERMASETRCARRAAQPSRLTASRQVVSNLSSLVRSGSMTIRAVVRLFAG